MLVSSTRVERGGAPMNSNTELVSVEWVVPASSASANRADLEELGAMVQPDETAFTPPEGEEAEYSEAAFEPLIIIAALMGLSILARRVISLVKDARQDGLIIDARRQPIQVRPHPALDRGQILVITTTGSQFFERSTDASDLNAFLSNFAKV